MTKTYEPLESTLGAFQQREIGKPTFISMMYDLHHAALFDYARFIGGTKVKRIEIDDGRAVMVSRDRGVRIECAEGDFRIAPVESLNFADYEKQDRTVNRVVPDTSKLEALGWRAELTPEAGFRHMIEALRG